MTLHRSLVMVLLLALLLPPAWSNTVAKPSSRTFGYVIGDVLVQNASLSTADNKFELADPIPLGRIGLWLERQSVNESVDQSNEAWLSIQYQIINAPAVITNDELPALVLVGNNGEELTVPASPYSLGPITAEQGAPTAALPLMQPDRAPELSDTRNANRLIRQYGLAFLSSLVAWLAWWYWREQKDRVKLPFAAAWHKIQQHDKTDASQHPEAWVAIHDALNRYGGKTVQQGTLPGLIEKHAWMSPMQTQLEAFFKSSSGFFFEHPARTESFPLNELSYELYQAEKRAST